MYCEGSCSLVGYFYGNLKCTRLLRVPPFDCAQRLPTIGWFGSGVLDFLVSGQELLYSLEPFPTQTMAGMVSSNTVPGSSLLQISSFPANNRGVLAPAMQGAMTFARPSAASAVVSMSNPRSASRQGHCSRYCGWRWFFDCDRHVEMEAGAPAVIAGPLFTDNSRLPLVEHCC